jgi:hypothetical protein
MLDIITIVIVSIVLHLVQYYFFVGYYFDSLIAKMEDVFLPLINLIN